MQSLVSIIVPVYQGETFVEQLFENLKPYQELGYEIIVVENGPKSGIESSLKAALPNANYLWTERANVSNARNLGASHSTGDFLQFLDVDDTIEPDKLTIQSKYALEHQLDLVYSDWRFVHHKGDEVIFQAWHDASKDRLLDLLLGSGWHPIHSFLWSKKAFHQIGGFDAAFKTAHEDANLLMHFLLRFKAGHCPGKFTNHHQYENHISLSSSRGLAYWEDSQRFWLGHLDALLERSDAHNQIASKLSQKLFGIVRNLAKYDVCQARALMEKLKQHFPDFEPGQESFLFRYAYKLLGYRLAERLASEFGRFKRQKPFAKFHPEQNKPSHG